MVDVTSAALEQLWMLLTIFASDMITHLTKSKRKMGKTTGKKKPQIKPKRLGFLIVYLCVFLWWFFGLCVATGRLLFGVNIANPSTSFSFIKINLKCSIVLIFHLLFYCCFCISAMAHRKIFVSFCVRGVLTGLALYVNQS